MLSTELSGRYVIKGTDQQVKFLSYRKFDGVINFTFKEMELIDRMKIVMYFDLEENNKLDPEHTQKKIVCKHLEIQLESQSLSVRLEDLHETLLRLYDITTCTLRVVSKTRYSIGDRIL